MIHHSDIEAIENLCREIGYFADKQQSRLNSSDILDKVDQSLVSYVDLEVEKRLTEGLYKINSRVNILAEEGNYRIHDHSPYRWIIDPIDGTTNYVHGLPYYCISMALEYNKEVTHSFIYHIAQESLYYAQKGSGSYKNGQTIEVDSANSLNDSLLVTGFPRHIDTNADAYFDLFKNLTLKTRGVRRMGSAALDLAWVADGKFSGFYEIQLKPWDIAAGILLVTEAGGEVSSIHHQRTEFYSGNLVASNSMIHNDLLSKVRASLIS